jgi:hypothetical protein
MTRDEARKLLGGYATGSLTEAERTALFQAAVEDQDLFDELAGEQVLKEVLDEPGARQRLIAVLERPKRQRAWLWVTAASTVAIAVVIGVVVSQRTPPPPPQQIAQVMKSPEPVNTPTAPPVAEPAQTRQRVAPRLAAPPPPAPPAEVSKDENAVAAQADQLQEAKPKVASEALRVNGVPQAAAAAAIAPRVFAFSYSVSADGFLEITPAAQGFLSVTASDTVLFPGTVVNAGTPVRIAIPSGATSLVIAFSRMQGITGTPVRRDAISGSVSDQDPPNGRILIQLFLTPATR